MAYQMAKARKGQPRNTAHEKDDIIGYYADEDQTALIERAKDTNQIYLKDLKVQTHHTGSVLLVRTIGYPQKLSVILPLTNGVEDETTDVERLNVLFNGTVKERTLLAKGNILLIKEPFFEEAGGSHYIRVDNPSNLVLLADDHVAVPKLWQSRDNYSALQWKLKGNAALKKEKVLEAIRCYERGLSFVVTDDTALKNDLHRNLSAAALQATQYDLAKTQALLSISKDDGSDLHDDKALLRAGTASYRLGDFFTAKSTFERLLNISPSHKPGIQMLEHTENRLTEEMTGQYDFEAMTITAQARFPEYGSFLRRTEIRPSKIAGRGLFTTEDIRCGGIVLCEKAFTAEPHPKSGPSKAAEMMDLHKNSKHIGSYAALFSATVRKIVDNPSLAHILDLHTDGTRESQKTIPLVDGLPAVDVFRVHSLLKRNVFSFGKHAIVNTPPTELNKIHETGADAVGLWYQVSHINHSCIANCHRNFIGDMMIVRANFDIPKNTEITLAYIEHSPLPSVQQEEFQMNWGFQCTCNLCISEQYITPNTKMYKHLVDAAATFKRWKTHPATATEVIRKAQELVDTITPLYPEYEKLPRLGVTNHHTMLMLIYKSKEQFDLMALNARQVIRDLGFILSVNGNDINMDRTNGIPEIHVVWALLFLSADTFEKGNSVLALGYCDLAEEIYTILNGTKIGFEEMQKQLDEIVFSMQLA
ncbi:SET domain-containing protein [Aureobasidium pullulans EXF-150]|uniref:SET domain-containing protein n=1 Tax=Aureobasidium pullulans EXF-150 TaxID=1043002 RepID=A0A074XKX5_AURPU|nr:SET domain-containing protein [Aureobasidium pullulans EXF-150]KEQ86123.1 SET domain-containing protein [Aureobasidium pullulans EXF-150]